MAECYECSAEGDFDDGYCEDCGNECYHCGETKSFRRDFSASDICDDCDTTYYCYGCEDLKDNPIYAPGLCEDCYYKKYPSEEYEAIMGSIKGFKEALAQQQIVLVTGSCCGTCSASEGGNKAEELGWRGYAYYHEQDEQGLRSGEKSQLLIGYGIQWQEGMSRQEAEDKVVEIARTVLAVLIRVGAWVDPWDGDTESRIPVHMPASIERHGLAELAALLKSPAAQGE